MVTAKMGTDTVGHFLGGEQACGLDDVALAVHPVRLNAIEPGTLAGQVEGDDTHALALLPDRSVLCPNPGAHRFADVPGGVIPNHDQDRLAQHGQLRTAPGQVLGGDWANRTVGNEAQPDLFGQGCRRGRTRDQQPVAGQRLGVGVISRRRLFHQTQHRVLLTPGTYVRLCHPAPPHFILETQDVFWMVCGQFDQPVAGAFFAHTPDRGS